MWFWKQSPPQLCWKAGLKSWADTAAEAGLSRLRDKERFYLPRAELGIVSDCITQPERCGELCASHCLRDVIGRRWQSRARDSEISGGLLG